MRSLTRWSKRLRPRAEEAGVDPAAATGLTTTAYLYDDSGNVEEEIPVTYDRYMEAAAVEEPNPADYGSGFPGFRCCSEKGLRASTRPNGSGAGAQRHRRRRRRGAGLRTADVRAVFLPCILEACGYMARIAFVMDRIFRKFGLSGKSFIPMLIGTGCACPALWPRAQSRTSVTAE
jgi:ferrous iron transport protein B